MLVKFTVAASIISYMYMYLYWCILFPSEPVGAAVAPTEDEVFPAGQGRQVQPAVQERGLTWVRVPETGTASFTLSKLIVGH